jgi:hypothetical protein
MCARSHLILVTFCLVAFAPLWAVAPRPQRPREQGAAPQTLEQCQREDAAYRDRIASLERQIDADEETERTLFLRVAMNWDAYQGAIRLADHYRLELATVRAERDALRTLNRRPTRR